MARSRNNSTFRGKRRKPDAIGRLRQEIDVQTNSKIADGMGGFTSGWATDQTVWADIQPVRGNEKYFGDKLEDRITHRIYVRYEIDIQTTQRILFEGRIFQVKSVRNYMERRDYREIDAIEGAAS